MPSILHVTQSDMGDNLQVDPSTDKITVKQATESITGAVKLYDRLDSNDQTGALSSNMGKELNEFYMEDLNNGAGSIVYRYIEDGGLHTVGEVWLSEYNIGYFRCLETNSDNYVESAKWEKIDDSANANKIKNLMTYSDYTLQASNTNFIFRRYGNIVYLSFGDAIFSGPSGTVVATISNDAMRPSNNQEVPVVSNTQINLNGRIAIEPNGSIRLRDPYNGTERFSGNVSFIAGKIV